MKQKNMKDRGNFLLAAPFLHSQFQVAADVWWKSTDDKKRKHVTCQIVWRSCRPTEANKTSLRAPFTSVLASSTNLSRVVAWMGVTLDSSNEMFSPKYCLENEYIWLMHLCELNIKRPHLDVATGRFVIDGEAFEVEFRPPKWLWRCM